jgi:uncharacterized protein YndB with AHSA1/START domain
MSERNDCIRVTTVVAADPATAFELFTAETDAWWRRGPRFRHGGDRPSSMRFEPFEGGRLLEEFGDDAGEAFEVGRVRVWKPAERVVFEWRAKAFEVGLITEVEVQFHAVERGTRVTLEHRGWDRVPLDNESRHGYGDSEAFVSMIGLYWADQLTALRGYGSQKQGSA